MILPLWRMNRSWDRAQPTVSAKTNAASVFAVKVAQSGGLIEGHEVAKIANLAGIDLYGGTDA